ncbi:hypothetical protein E4U53_006329 [Claviceps sorghi]|nr:hypothetical protein E4U53_006329 [Claviceps sorghi]
MASASLAATEASCSARVLIKVLGTMSLPADSASLVSSCCPSQKLLEAMSLSPDSASPASSCSASHAITVTQKDVLATKNATTLSPSHDFPPPSLRANVQLSSQ